MSYMPTRTGGASVTSVASAAASTQLLAANPARLGVTIVNTDANALYIVYGTTANTTAGNFSYIIGAGATWEMPWGVVYSGPIYGIWASDGSGVAEITEI